MLLQGQAHRACLRGRSGLLRQDLLQQRRVVLPGPLYRPLEGAMLRPVRAEDQDVRRTYLQTRSAVLLRRGQPGAQAAHGLLREGRGVLRQRLLQAGRVVLCGPLHRPRDRAMLRPVPPPVEDVCAANLQAGSEVLLRPEELATGSTQALLRQERDLLRTDGLLQEGRGLLRRPDVLHAGQVQGRTLRRHQVSTGGPGLLRGVRLHVGLEVLPERQLHRCTWQRRLLRSEHGRHERRPQHQLHTLLHGWSLRRHLWWQLLPERPPVLWRQDLLPARHDRLPLGRHLRLTPCSSDARRSSPVFRGSGSGISSSRRAGRIPAFGTTVKVPRQVAVRPPRPRARRVAAPRPGRLARSCPPAGGGGCSPSARRGRAPRRPARARRAGSRGRSGS